MNLLPLRSEIYLANLNPTIGGEIQKTRPVVIVSQNDMNRYMETIVVCPLTTVIHPTWRCRLQISCAGVDAELKANAEDVAVEADSETAAATVTEVEPEQEK